MSHWIGRISFLLVQSRQVYRSFHKVRSFVNFLDFWVNVPLAVFFNQFLLCFRGKHIKPLHCRGRLNMAWSRASGDYANSRTIQITPRSQREDDAIQNLVPNPTAEQLEAALVAAIIIIVVTCYQAMFFKKRGVTHGLRGMTHGLRRLTRKMQVWPGVWSNLDDTMAIWISSPNLWSQVSLGTFVRRKSLRLARPRLISSLVAS